LDKVHDIEQAVVRLAVALDLDSGPDQAYQGKLRKCLLNIETKIKAFQAKFQEEISQHGLVNPGLPR